MITIEDILKNVPDFDKPVDFYLEDRLTQYKSYILELVEKLNYIEEELLNTAEFSVYLEMGKLYKTRDGRKVLVKSMTINGRFAIITDEKGSTCMVDVVDGCAVIRAQSDNDIMSLWK